MYLCFNTVPTLHSECLVGTKRFGLYLHNAYSYVRVWDYSFKILLQFLTFNRFEVASHSRTFLQMNKILLKEGVRNVGAM